MKYNELLVKIVGLTLVIFSAPTLAIDDNGIYSRQDVLEEYAEGLSYLDNKIFVYEVDLSGNGYNDILLTSDDDLYFVSRFGHKQFRIYTRLASGNEDYFLKYGVTLKTSDNLGLFSSSDQKYIQAVDITGKDYYYWIDRDYKLHTTDIQSEGSVTLESPGQFEREKFKALYAIERFLKQTYEVEDILPVNRKALKQAYADSYDSKVRVTSSDYITKNGSIGSRKYEWVEGGERIYLGDYIEQGKLFYPQNEHQAEKLYQIVVERHSYRNEDADGTVRWEFKPTLAPEWAESHPEMAAKIKILSESCLPREICEPTSSQGKAPLTNGNKNLLANGAGNANNSTAVTKEGSNETPVIEDIKQEPQWQQAIVWICVFIGFVFVVGMYIRSRRIKKTK